MQAKEGEAVVFSWILWPSKERDAGHERMKNDSRMNMGEMPFDGQRMIFGGFDVIVESR